MYVSCNVCMYVCMYKDYTLPYVFICVYVYSTSGFVASQQSQVVLTSTGSISVVSSGSVNAAVSMVGNVAINDQCTLTLFQVRK